MKTELQIVLVEHHKYIIEYKFTYLFGLFSHSKPIIIKMYDKVHKHDILLQGDSMIDAHALVNAVKNAMPMFATIDGIYGVQDTGIPIKLTGKYPHAL